MKRIIIFAMALGSWAIMLTWTPACAVLLEAPYAGPLSTITLPGNYHFVDIGWAWTAPEKAVIREALKEWDDRLCFTTSFVEDLTKGFSFDWAGDAVFNNNWGGADFSNALALCVPTGAANAPSGVATNQIYFNVKYQWYVDPDPSTNENFAGYDLLSVAKHEIGHILGITGDYKDPARRSEVMWYAFAEGERRTPTNQDFNELKKLGYHVVPEPSTVLLLGSGLLFGLLGTRRKFKTVNRG